MLTSISLLLIYLLGSIFSYLLMRTNMKRDWGYYTLRAKRANIVWSITSWLGFSCAIIIWLQNSEIKILPKIDWDKPAKW